MSGGKDLPPPRVRGGNNRRVPEPHPGWLDPFGPPASLGSQSDLLHRETTQTFRSSPLDVPRSFPTDTETLVGTVPGPCPPRTGRSSGMRSGDVRV